MCEKGPAFRRGLRSSGADNGVRTRDPHLGKVVLYQLSHVREDGGENRIRTGDEGFAGPCLTTWPSRHPCARPKAAQERIIPKPHSGCKLLFAAASATTSLCAGARWRLKRILMRSDSRTHSIFVHRMLFMCIHASVLHAPRIP